MTLLNPQDKFLINDGTKTETVTWGDMLSEANPLLLNVTISATEVVVDTPLTVTPFPSGGSAPYSYTYQWHTADDADGMNQADITGATDASYTPVGADIGLFLGCTVTVTDDLGSVAVASAYASSAAEPNVELAQPSVLTPADGAGIGGDINYFPETSAITSVDVDESAGFEVMPGDQRFIEMTFGDGRHVAVGRGGSNPTQSMVCTDGKTWDVIDNAFGSQVISNEFILYGGGQFLTAGAKGNTYSIATSPDGVTWSPRMITGNGAKDYSWGCGAYNGSVYVIATSSTGGTNDFFLTSPDGINWTSGTAPNTNMRFADGHLAANPATGTIIALNYNTSYDIVNRSTNNGASFQSNTQLNGSSSWDDLTFADGIFAVKKRNSDQIYTSRDDGLTWSRETARLPTSPSNGAFGYANGRWMFVGQGFIYYSDDLTSWETVEQEENIRPTSFAYGNGVFWEIGSQATHSGEYGMGFSPDGITWDAYTVLNLTNNKAFNSSDGTEITTIDKAFKAGDKVIGEGSATVFADSPVFSTYLYNGNGNNPQFLPTAIDNTVKALAWFKNRDANQSHRLYDTVRGANVALYSDTTSQENTLGGGFTFEEGGIQLDSFDAGLNDNGVKQVIWNFRAAPGFLDIVTYDGNDSVQTVPHSLGSAPGMMIVKNITNSASWTVYHKEQGATKYGRLNSDAAFESIAYWDNTEPTATEFTVGNFTQTNSSGSQYVAYLFADTTGKIKCGKYDGSSNAVTVDCGFEPEFLLVKAHNTTRDWGMFDLKRNGDSTFMGNTIFPNKSDSEVAYGNSITTSSSGFTVAAPGPSTPSAANDAGLNFVYVAIAKDASGGDFFPTGVLTEDAAGTSMTLTDVTGTWAAGLTAVNETEATETGPGADEVVFTSSKPATTNGTVNTWGQAEWQLSVDSGFVDKQEASVSLQNVDVEQGPTSFTLAEDTEYWVRTRYNSADPAADPSDWSDANKFKTAAPGGGADGNFSTTTYVGNDTADTPHTTGVDNTDKALCWFKSIYDGRAHALVSTDDNSGYLNTAGSSSSRDPRQPFGSGRVLGFTDSGVILNNTSYVNHPGETYACWNFAAAPNFFDVVPWSGTGDSTMDVPHNLKAEVGCVITKCVNKVSGWPVYHKALGNGSAVNLNTDSVKDDGAYWGTMTTENLGFTQYVNHTQVDYDWIAYVFADAPDYGVKCGSETSGGDFSAVNFELGFKPGWVLIKDTGASANWEIYDLERGLGTDATNNPALQPNQPDGQASTNRIASTATGFTYVPANTNSLYIYVAIADTTVIFYDENAATTVTNHQLVRRYGVDPLTTDLRKFGIFPLTEQPTYPVAAYVKEGREYKPVRDYRSDYIQVSNRLNDLQSVLEARITALESE